MGEIGRQLAVGVNLGEEIHGLLLGGGDGISARGPAQRRLVLVGDRDQRLRPAPVMNQVCVDVMATR